MSNACHCESRSNREEAISCRLGLLRLPTSRDPRNDTRRAARAISAPAVICDALLFGSIVSTIELFYQDVKITLSFSKTRKTFLKYRK